MNPMPKNKKRQHIFFVTNLFLIWNIAEQSAVDLTTSVVKKIFSLGGNVDASKQFYIDPKETNSQLLIPKILNGENVVIVSPSQTGKTTMARRFMLQLQQMGYLPILFVHTISLHGLLFDYFSYIALNYVLWWHESSLPNKGFGLASLIQWYIQILVAANWIE